MEKVYKVDSPVRITSGKYLGHDGVVEKITSKMIYVKTTASPEKAVRVFKTSVCEIDELDMIFNAMKINNHDTPTKLGNTNSNIQKIMMSSKSDEKNTVFLKIWLQTEILSIVHSDEIESSFYNNNQFYVLVASKCDKNESNGFYSKKQNKISYYAAVTESESHNIQKELDKLANFQQLTNISKVVSRLELLISSVAKKDVHLLSSEIFEMIDEPQPSEDSGGCGFISPELLAKLIGGKVGLRVTSIQVRIFSPLLGIFKGMLTIKPGIKNIQLSPEMLKVWPSVTNSTDERVWLLVKNVFPSYASLNMAKWLKGISLPKSYVQNKLSDMMKRMFKSSKIPSEVISSYSKLKFRKEAWVVGVTDPTDAIPQGYVYITGLAEYISKQGCVHCYVTRSPCVLPTDARMVPVLTSKPENMSISDWNSLSARSFGEIIFHNKKKTSEEEQNTSTSTSSQFDKKSDNDIGLPTLLGDGDLDGDLYYVCWDENILHHAKPPLELVTIKTEKLKNNDENNNENPLRLGCNNASSSHTVSNTNWLQKAQLHMMDDSILTTKKLIGKFYTEMNKIADASELGAYDPDAILLAIAYKQAIDGQKHGGSIDLPDHLKKRLGL